MKDRRTQDHRTQDRPQGRRMQNCRTPNRELGSGDSELMSEGAGHRDRRPIDAAV